MGDFIFGVCIGIMIGALISFILYFALGEDKTVFFYVCGASLFLKMMEFVFRFFLR